MLTGIDHILQERQEQIHKHGWDVKHDSYYHKNELIDAALFCIDPQTFRWPEDWDDHFKQKILKKDRVNQLRVAGAFFMAENDRLGRNVYNTVIEKIAARIDGLLLKQKAVI